MEREIPSGTRREHAELARHVLGFQSDDGLKETTYSVARRSFRGVTLIGNPAIPVLRLKSFRTSNEPALTSSCIKADPVT